MFKFVVFRLILPWITRWSQIDRFDHVTRYFLHVTRVVEINLAGTLDPGKANRLSLPASLVPRTI